MKLLLRSPLHFLVSGSLMLLRFPGKKTGKIYSVPVEYFFDGDRLAVLTRFDRRWWRNLGGGASVTARLRGREVRGISEVYPRDRGAFRAAIQSYLEIHPGRAKYFGIARRENGTLEPRTVEEAASERVVVGIQLEGERS